MDSSPHRGEVRPKGGEGVGDPTAVLLHGATADGATWAGFAERLTERGWQVTTPDLRGGTLEEMAAGLLSGVPAGPDLAIGHSLGGAVLLTALDRLQPRQAVYADPAWRFELSADRQSAGRRFLTTATRDQWRRMLPRLSDRDLDAFIAAAAKWDFEGPAQVDMVPGRPPTVPSLILLSRELGYDVPGYQVVRLHGVGHFMFWEDPDQCLQAIEDFVAG